jgi:hypothetical protein
MVFLIAELASMLGLVAGLTSPLYLILPLYLHAATIHWAITASCRREDPPPFDTGAFGR